MFFYAVSSNTKNNHFTMHMDLYSKNNNDTTQKIKKNKKMAKDTRFLQLNTNSFRNQIKFYLCRYTGYMYS